MSAIISSAIDQARAELRRWWLSAMLAVAVHGVAAMAVLTWHSTSGPFDSARSPAAAPFFIDLEPLPAPRSPEPPLPRQKPGLDRGAARPEPAFGAAEAADAAHRDHGTQSLGLQPNAAGPRADVPIVDAPMAPAPDNAEQDAGGASAAATLALAAGHINDGPVDTSQASRVDPGPIDTSISVLPGTHQRKAFSAFNRNRMILLRPNAAGPHDVSGHGSLSHGPGARLHDRVNAAIERELIRRAERARNGSAAPATNSLGMTSPITTSVHDNAKNAIGAATPSSGIRNAAAGVANGMARNAIGIATEFDPRAHGPGVDQRREGVAAEAGVAGAIGLTGVSPSRTGLQTGAPPPGILNGRGIARPGMSLTPLGGPPKNVPGVLSGSDFHAKLGTRYGP